MPNLFFNKLKQIAKIRCIKGYKSMFKERLLSAFDKSESAGTGNNFNNARIKKIREDFNKLREIFKAKKMKSLQN